MRKWVSLFLILVLAPASSLFSQSSGSAAQEESVKLREEIEQLKKALKALESRLSAQEKAAEEKQSVPPAPAVTQVDLQKSLKELDRRVAKTEKNQALDKIQWGGDYRFEAHSINATVPDHFDGMKLQNLVVKSMFAMGATGQMPSSIGQINQIVASHYSDYQYFTNNLTFNQLKQGMAQFPPAMQQQLMGLLMPSTFVPSYKDNNSILYTNRLRLNMDAKMTDNLSFTGRLSMYKVFGDSSTVQLFNGSPTSMSFDGTTTRVPNSDILRVERAYFTWNKIGGSPFYLSIGRRPSTDGPPLNFRNDEPRGGTPMGTLIDFQFDGITAGYHAGEHTTLRLCYGLGYESGFGNGNILKTPEDRLKDVHFLGGNVDLWNSEKMLVQTTVARAYRVTDGFNGLAVMPNNPLTGEVLPPVLMRYTPSTNLGDINLGGLLLQRRDGPVDWFVTGNFVTFSPFAVTTPFGGLMSDPFENPESHKGGMFYAGIRYNFPNGDKTKLGFEFNHGSKYWFNFAMAADDIIAPKTNTRGNVAEAYLTHRLNKHFIFKVDVKKYAYAYSGSGWHLGAPKDLNSTPILGFPSYKNAFEFSTGLTTRF
jgi:hypothetical protein